MVKDKFGNKLKCFVNQCYKRSSKDLCTTFIERAVSLVGIDGAIGMITMHAWMFLDSYSNLRPWMLSTVSIDTMAHLGKRAFDSIAGEVVQTTAFTLANAPSDTRREGVYLRLVDGKTEGEKETMLCEIASQKGHDLRFEVSAASFSLIPGKPIVYWASQQTLAAFKNGVPLGEVTNPRSGLCTGNNSLFVREWFEVSKNRSYLKANDRSDAVASKAKWFPYNKGGEFRRWWGNQNLVVNWGGVNGW